jgi:hypothetical protein
VRTTHTIFGGFALATVIACGSVRDNRQHDAAIDDTNGGPDVLSGPPNLTVEPLTHDFGPVSLSATSTPFTVTFKNSGAESATGCTAPARSGANPTEFEITADTCGTADLAGGASCTVGVSAKPTLDGIRTMTLSRTCTAGGTATTTADGYVVNRPMYIFVTSAMTSGNLGGLAGADAKCAAAGAAGSQSGPKNRTWKALISQKTGTQTDAKDRFVWTGPLYDMSGQIVTRNPSVWPWAATGTGGTTARDENNVTAGSYTWTGSTIDGVAAPADCNGWADGTTAFNGRAGETGSFPGSGWFDSFNNGCSDTFFALYCVSQ